ncbi:MAG: DUF742 domain-containing protein [Acidimicrobiales bacterium]
MTADPQLRPAPVRPYVLTGGRTRSTIEVAMEAQVQATGSSARPAIRALGDDSSAIVEMCWAEPVPVAEVAARLGVPLQVARVLIGDLVEVGALTVGATPDERPDLDLLERMLEGLQVI